MLEDFYGFMCEEYPLLNIEFRLLVLTNSYCVITCLVHLQFWDGDEKKKGARHRKNKNSEFLTSMTTI